MPYPVSIACAPAVALLLLPSLSVSQPASWRPRIASGDMLYSPSDVLTPSDSMPMIGNGWMASQLKSDSIYLSGLFNGYLTVGPSHRARIPATDAMPPPGEVVDAALDVRNATYYRRSKLNPSPPGACDLNSNTTCSNAASPVWLEQRWYAHRSLGSVLVMEVQLLTADEVQVDYGVQAQVQSTSSEPLAMLYLPNAPGAPSSDIDFIPIPMPADSPFQVVNGSTLVPETNSSGLERHNLEQMWTHTGPPNIQCMKVARMDGDATSGSGSRWNGILPDAVHRAYAVMTSTPFMHFIAAVTGSKVTGVAASVRCFARGEYSMVVDPEVREERRVAKAARVGVAPPAAAAAAASGSAGSKRPALASCAATATVDVTLCCVGAEEWPQAHGGYITYMTAEEELLTVPPKRNSLSIVCTDATVLSFVKYVTARAMENRLDIHTSFLVQ